MSEAQPHPADSPPRQQPAASFDNLQRALVIGASVSGRAATRLLREASVAVTVLESDDGHHGLADVDALGAEVAIGDTVERDQWARYDVVVASPGVPEHAPAVVDALAAGVPVWSEPELAWRWSPRTVLGITGTNGKTTTTEMLTSMLRADGRDVIACGNIGIPLSEAVMEHAPSTVLVAELSSFQLRFTSTLRVRVGVLLNLAEDHLDWHGDMHAYAAAKARMWRSQAATDWAVANADDPAALALMRDHAPGYQATFSVDSWSSVAAGESGRRSRPSGGVRRVLSRATGSEVPRASITRDADGLTASDHQRRELLVQADVLDGRPVHVTANLAAAATAAWLFGVSPQAIAAASHDTGAGPHRGEEVTSARGICWINNSKATNPHAAIAALSSYDSAVWIAGGTAKGVDLSPLSRHLGNVRAAVLIGTSAPELARICDTAGVAAHAAASIEDAVGIAAGLAVSGDAVVLAPACASFDQFRDYRDRGDRFSRAVNLLVANTAV
ncbi:MAG: UDP-N-acetylmuramoyl-L-alanine--D-glutamate ligase [Nitriliruptoraceae bacterium]